MGKMPLAPARPQSTRLDNLNLEPDGASFELDGRPVRLAHDTAGPAVAALHAFYQSALVDYRQRGPGEPKPGWFARLRSWLGRLIGGAGPTHPEPALPPPVLVSASPGPRQTPPPAVRAAPEPESSYQPAHGGTGRRADNPSPTHPAAEPRLRAVFADPGGVHLIWQAPGARESASRVECLHPLDSELARRLGDCYGQLEKLGFRVVGLDLLRTSPSLPVKPTGPAPEPDQPVTGPRPALPMREPAAHAGGEPQKSAEKKEATLVMRLLPDVLEEPNRALVSPVDNAENAQILVAPEKVLRALRSAADPARPAEERLTYLRCAQAKGGLKLVEVGIGEGKDRGPAQWEDLSRWLPRQEAETAPAARKMRPAPEAAAPRPGAQPELSL